MTYKLPIKITEQPHRGERRTWTLHDEKHLNTCIAAASERGDYDEWCAENGYVIFSENEAGDFEAENDKRGELDTYLDWLRHDLRSLDVEEISADTAPAVKARRPQTGGGMTL